MSRLPTITTEEELQFGEYIRFGHGKYYVRQIETDSDWIEIYKRGLDGLYFLHGIKREFKAHGD